MPFNLPQFLPGRERGASLISSLMSVGILALGITGASLGFKNIYSARRNTAATAATKDIEDSIVQTLSATYKSFISAKCSSTAQTSLSSLAVGTLVRMTYSRNIFLQTNLDGAYRTNAATDISRCEKRPFTDVTPIPSSSRFFACYQITVDSNLARTSGKDTFAANKGAFVEVLVNVRDLRIDTPAACSAMAAGLPGFGIELYYSFHWVLNNSTGPMYKTRIGSVHVAL